MRSKLHEDTYTVTVEPEEVSEFMKTWPCSGLIPAIFDFTFSRHNGDLVDAEMDAYGIRKGGTESCDGPALAALSEDAGIHGARELGLDEVLALRAPAGNRI